MNVQDWRAVGVSVIGTSHTKTNTCCQDSHRLKIITGNEEVVAMIVSDGAGSASRSQAGSQAACVDLMASLEDFLSSGGLLRDIHKPLARQWLEKAAAVITELAAVESLSVRDFACTLLAAFISPTHSVFIQVGDGAIVFWPRGDDGWCLMIWPQHGEFVNSTVFLTESSSRDNFEFCSRPDVVDEVAVFTDGIEALVLHNATKTVHGPFFDSVFPAVRSLSKAGISAELSEKLGAYLGSSSICDRTDDDKTLLLASRSKTAQRVQVG